MRIWVEAACLTVEVSDDGRGGAVAEVASGSGLAGLQDRVAAIGGTLSIESPVGRGTKLLAALPLEPKVSSAAGA